MLNFIVSLFLGMFPEVLYFTLFLTFTMNLKSKRLLLFSALSVGYVLLIMICRYELLFYLAYIVYSYLVLKVLYKAHILNLFVYSVSFSYLMILSFVTATLIDNYVLAYIVDRVLLFVPFIFYRNFNLYYECYKSLWDRKQGNKIKSITLRNMSLVFVNIMILFVNAIAFASAIMFTSH